jgi:uncharacterized DUF497 family protein
MNFEWDEDKNRYNIAKHGISFELAKNIFDGYILTTEDRRFDYGEIRQISIGQVDTKLMITVVHTDRANITRIISARLANKKERQIYEEALRQRAHHR